MSRQHAMSRLAGTALRSMKGRESNGEREASCSRPGIKKKKKTVMIEPVWPLNCPERLSAAVRFPLSLFARDFVQCRANIKSSLIALESHRERPLAWGSPTTKHKTKSRKKNKPIRLDSDGDSGGGDGFFIRISRHFLRFEQQCDPSRSGGRLLGGLQVAVVPVSQFGVS